MKETALIVLPLPGRILSPNAPAASFGGRMGKARAAASYRQKAKEVAESAQIETTPWKLASVKATFYFGTKRRRDQDNAMASLKAAYDGVASSGLLVDDDYEHLRRESPEFFFDEKSPRVELLFTREDDNV